MTVTSKPVTHLADLANPAACPRIVYKIGSALLVGPDGAPRREWLAGLADEIADARRAGQDVIVVSSGATALGAARLGLDKGGRGSLPDAQAAAAVGQIELGGIWSDLLGAHGLIAAQLLVTLEDLEDRRRYLNASATLARLLEAGVVPVVNENDSVATAKLRFGDNDRLAARVAQAADADAVLLLSDVDGLYDRNPSDPAAKRVPVVRGVTDELHDMADGGSASGLGTGGMTTKLKAAQIAERAGIALVIANGFHDKPVSRALRDGIGTLFLPRRNDTGKRAWLGGRMQMKGSLMVDAGAAIALQAGGSLLAKGISAIEGEFQRGDPIMIRDERQRAIAKGLAEYDAAECHKIIGHHSSEQASLLGYEPRSAVVHRDQMVLL
ncbi:glutamate 5-kinase [Croceicoccus sp. F390]|uniref:Glutamate 5-kinase n=1 Tax=Croceicoccus esteveae TaxID=3075597 RepID=A0ABU2ZGY5_9SPHN|nr:glutamate 5-kinase [Croceicoccus sp. F390]MDT0575640.1 glutamate 5-kinase [Croceicoccus sp. F390]